MIRPFRMRPFDPELVHHPACTGLPGCLDTCPITREEYDQAWRDTVV